MILTRYVAYLVACIVIVIWQAGCDDYNIVEPRFYDGDDIVALPNCGEIEFSSDALLSLGVIPDAFAFGVCQGTFPTTGRAIVVVYDVPVRAEVNLGLFNSAGILVHSIVNGSKEAASYADYVENVDALERGVYGISMVASDFKGVIWFEIN